jgi:hypothetical protein
LGAWHGLVVGNPPLDSVGEWRKLARLDKMEELLAGNIGARPIRHRDSKVFGLAGSTSSGAVADVEELGAQRASARGRRRRWESKVPN